MVTIVLLFLGGVSLSAFFSGSETGFYRANRLRLVMDAMSGGLVAPNLLRLTNHPTLFVATTLVGNNVANYLASLAVVLLSRRLSADSAWLDLMLPVLSSPIVFVYGELLPKNLFYHAPNLLLRHCGPLFLAFTVLFAPVSALLWLLGRVLQAVLGQTPLRVHSTLARKELHELIQEGQAAGLLHPIQRQLAEKLMQVASQPVRTFCRSTVRMPLVQIGQPKDELLRVARRLGQATMLVTDGPRGPLTGYVRVIDLRLSDASTLQTCWPLLRFPATETQLGALIRMQAQNIDLAEVLDERDASLGVVFLGDLIAPLFRT